MLRMFILAAMLLAGTAVANEPPPIPEESLVTLHTSACSDSETGQRGTCYLMQDVEGIVYVTFWQEETLMFIRQIVGDGYIVIWVNDLYGIL